MVLRVSDTLGQSSAQCSVVLDFRRCSQRDPPRRLPSDPRRTERAELSAHPEWSEDQAIYPHPAIKRSLASARQDFSLDSTLRSLDEGLRRAFASEPPEPC